MKTSRPCPLLVSAATCLAAVKGAEAFAGLPRLKQVTTWTCPLPRGELCRPGCAPTVSRKVEFNRLSRQMVSDRQSVEGGVMLPPAEDSEAYASFLADSIMQHLDQEWLPQDCHRDIGLKVGDIYRKFVKEGNPELSSLVMEIGTGLETFDMGDSFVGPWDIANVVSDFIMARMGAETSACSTKLPDLPQAASEVASSHGNEHMGPDGRFELVAEDVKRIRKELTSEFSRYRFLVGFMGESVEWSDMDVLMAIYQGYTPGEGENVRSVWRQAFPGSMPPRLEKTNGVVEALEAEFPEEPDAREGLEVIVLSVYGEDAVKFDEGDAEKGIPPDEGYLKRAAICKWLYLMGYLHREVSRAPDEVSINLTAEMISQED